MTLSVLEGIGIRYRAWGTRAMLVAISCVSIDDMDLSSSHGSAAGIVRSQNGKHRAVPLRPADTIGHLLNHPALAGFGHLTLPWDDRRYDLTMPLTNIGTLLP